MRKTSLVHLICFKIPQQLIKFMQKRKVLFGWHWWLRQQRIKGNQLLTNNLISKLNTYNKIQKGIVFTHPPTAMCENIMLKWLLQNVLAF